MESILNYKEEDLVLDLDEGVNDPGIFKAIILAGGPGSGKSYVAKKLGLKTLGLVVVNSDQYFELLMKRKGLSLKMPENETEDREVARMAAKGLTDKRYKSLIDARMGIIIDSTSGDQGKTFRMYRELKSAGYDVKSIFIQTDLDVALQRNNERARTIPPRVVEQSHKSAQTVKKLLQKKMGRDYHEIVNNGGSIDISVAGKLTTWSKKPNASALEWIAAVKRGMDSSVKEDINTSIMDSFKEYIEMQEALNMQQRLARGRVAKRTAKKRARSAKKKAMRMKGPDDMLKKAGMMARNKVAMKLSGGIPLSQLTISQKVQLGKKLDKKKAAIAKLTKKLLPGAKKAERDRIGKLRGK
jgi:adenylate kinase family enzyme